jgi:hypothetical protein
MALIHQEDIDTSLQDIKGDLSHQVLPVERGVYFGDLKAAYFSHLHEL